MSDTPKTYESDTPETCEAVERWRQGKINIFDEMARLERERDEAREDAKAADEHRRLAERLAEAAMFERDQLRMRVAELESGMVVEGSK